MHGALQLAVLGKPQLTYNNQLLTAELIAAKGQALLIHLAVTGQPHSRTALAGLLWGDMPEETARANLRLTLSKLRKILPDDILQTSRLQVALADYWLDITEFFQRLEIRDRRLESNPTSISQPQAANTSAKLSTGLQSLLDLYRGDFLDDFQLPNAPEFEEWTAVTREHLRQTAVSKLSAWAETALQNNDPATGIPIARKVLAIEPWHEETHRHLMHLLALSGQRSAALTQYETCRRLLADELDIDPDTATTALYKQIKNGEFVNNSRGAEEQRGREEISSSPYPPISSFPNNNLPPQLTPFIGRAAELIRLTERLAEPDYRLLTLLGEGGVGKTRLALMAAEQVKTAFADGVWFVSLVGLETAVFTTDPLTLENHIATTIATAMDIIFVSAEPPRAQLLHYLRGKNCLLLLDNFEPFLPAAGFVLEILTSAHDVTILTTSREPLHLQAEAIVRLNGLALPETAVSPHAADTDAVRLFAERAERTTGQQVVTPDVLPQVIQLCRFVNGLPLGIELIASWTRWLALPDILQGLEENALRLETTREDIAPRHRSMRAVFDYSWTLLLNGEEQRVLAQCAVFRRRFQLEAMREVIGSSPSTLFALVDKSLVQHHDDGYYSLHELLRQYASARLAELMADQAVLYGRHAAYYLQIARQVETALVGPKPHAALRRIQADNENLAQAWQWACQIPIPDLLTIGVSGMSRYWTYAGLFGEGEQALATAVSAIEPLLTSPESQPELCRLLARLYAERACLLFDINRLDEMEEAAQTCLHWAAVVEDGVLEANGRLRLGQVCWRRSNCEAAGEQFQQAQELAAAATETELEAVIWRNLAAVTWRLGNLEMAEEACQHSLRLHQQIGDIRGENRTRHFFSILALERHDYDAVHTWLEPVTHLAHEIGERRVELGIHAILGQVYSYQGEYELALAHFARERELLEEINVPWQSGGNASNAGDTLLRLGDFAGAQASYAQALTIFRQLQSVQPESNVLAFMGFLAAKEGRFEDGRSLCTTALQLAQQVDARREQAFARSFLAHNLAGLGRWAEAKPVYERAQAAWQILNDPLRTVEARAGAAQSMLMLGDVAGAVTVVNDIFAYLAANTAVGADDPLRIYLVCYEVLKQAGDERAEMVLENGRALLQDYANRIQNPALRQMFLQNIPSHAAILGLANGVIE